MKKRKKYIIKIINEDNINLEDDSVDKDNQ
jgi:hypothetical protein